MPKARRYDDDRPALHHFGLNEAPIVANQHRASYRMECKGHGLTLVPQPHPRPEAVGVNEHDAGSL